MLKYNFSVKLVYLFFFILSPIIGFSQAVFSPEQLKEDLVFLDKKLKKYHPGLYAYRDTVAYQSDFEYVFSSIEKPTDYYDFYKRLAPIVNGVKDLHTSYRPSKKWSAQNDRYLPFYIRSFQQKYYIAYYAANDSLLCRGDQILSIDGKAIADLVNQNARLYGADNGNEYAQKYYAVRAFAAYYNRLHGALDSAMLTIKRVNEDTLRQVLVRGMKQTEIPKNVSKLYPQALRKNFTYKIPDSTRKTAVLNITSFVKKSSPFDIVQHGFKKGLKKAFVQVKKDSIEHLVLDMRVNGGGYVPNVGRLLKYLSTEDFKLMEKMSFKKEAFTKLFPPYQVFPALVGLMAFKPNSQGYYERILPEGSRKQPKKRNHYSGRLTVLMDAGSYSATVFTISKLQDMQRARLIGERAGGAGWGSYAGRWYTAKLPYTKILVRIPLFKMEHHLPHKTNKQFFIEPDIATEENFDDFLQFKDTNLLRALAD